MRAADAAGNLSAYSAIVTSRDTSAADTTRPTAPTGLGATAAGPTQIDLDWTASTDNVGVTGYRVERCQGTGCTNFAQVGTPSATAFIDTGLAASPRYRYRVRAVDAAGNLGAYSSIATATTPAVVDTTPPSAPTGLTATRPGRSGEPELDRLDRQRRRQRLPGRALQGAGCTNFAQVGTPTASTYNDSGRLRPRPPTATGAGGRRLRQPRRLLHPRRGHHPRRPVHPAGSGRGLGVQRGSGPTTADASGRGNQGTLTGATWTTLGRYGNALSFNGSNSVVRVADSASLDLTTAMTLSAWVRPDRQPERMANHPPAPDRLLLPQRQQQRRTAAPVGRRDLRHQHHIRERSDGQSGQRLDPRGPHLRRRHPAAVRQRHPGRQPRDYGTIEATDNPLWIGGNTPYGEYFTGLIDKVRVYNRALETRSSRMNSRCPAPDHDRLAGDRRRSSCAR